MVADLPDFAVPVPEDLWWIQRPVGHQHPASVAER